MKRPHRGAFFSKKMKKITITVPKGIQYLGQWEGFELPDGILAKSVTGCGGTECFLKEKNNGVLASPRIKLISSKHAQHPDTILVLGKIKPEQIKAEIEAMRNRGILFVKILCTYDAVGKVVKALGEEVNSWHLLLDEFQLLILDSAFKSETEMKVLNVLPKFGKATLMSATPLLDEIIEQIPQLRDMPYTELKWDGVRKHQIRRWKTNKPKLAVRKIIDEYRTDRYPSLTLDDGRTVESREACFFINSVQSICNIIMDAQLSAAEVNIICGDTDDNDRLLLQLGEKMGNGEVYKNSNAPLRGEPHRTFTFATSTAFAGVDFYSTSALTFVVCDHHSPNTIMSIEYELAQIVGRQRLTDNHFRDYCYLIYNNSMADVDDKQFLEMMSAKEQLTLQEIENDNLTTGKLRAKRVYERTKEQKALCFADTWTLYDKDHDVFIFNQLKKLAEFHAYHLQNHLLKVGFLTVELEKNKAFKLDGEEEFFMFEEVLANSIQRTSFEDLMRRYVQYREGPTHRYDLLARELENEHTDLKAFVDTIGCSRIKALQFKKANLEQELVNRKSQDRVLQAYKEAFAVGSKWSTQEIKSRMTEINGQLAILYRGKPRKGKVIDLKNEWGFTIEHDRKSKLHTIIAHPSAEKMSSLL